MKLDFNKINMQYEEIPFHSGLQIHFPVTGLHPKLCPSWHSQVCSQLIPKYPCSHLFSQNSPVNPAPQVQLPNNRQQQHARK